MKFECILFLTQQSEKNAMGNGILYNKDKKLNKTIKNLLQTSNIKLVKYDDFNEFIKKPENENVYYNGYTQNEKNTPYRDVLYIRINNNYYIDNKDYIIKKWDFYKNFYNDVYGIFGMKRITNKVHNGMFSNKEGSIGAQGMSGDCNIAINNINSIYTDLENSREFSKNNNLESIISKYITLSYEEKIKFIIDKIDNPHKKIIYQDKIQSIEGSINQRTKNNLNIIEDIISITINNIHDITLKLKGGGFGLNFNYKKQVMKDENIMLSIEFYEFTQTPQSIKKTIKEDEPIPEAIKEDKTITEVIEVIDVNINKKLSNSNTQLIEAVWYQKIDTVKSLLSRGAQVDLTQVDGVSPLMFAVEKGNIEIIDLLLKNGADIHLKANNKNTALIVASWWGRDECTKVLLEAGARVNTQQCDGITALHFAAEKDFNKVVKHLLAYGADKTIKSNCGKTAIDAARIHGHNGDVYLMLK